MKAKLLKKVRKRFEIIHMPNGFTSGGERFEGNIYKLTDSTNSWWERYAKLEPGQGKDFQIFETESECIYYLKQCILTRLRREGHLGRKDNWMKAGHRKVWYK